MIKKVKICGITNKEDALFACENGADALGFIFYEKSPRYIAPEEVAEIIKKLPPFVTKVALFVNESAEKIDEICALIKADLAQIHFDADKNLYDTLKTKHIKVIRARSRDDLLRYENEYRIVDAFVEGYGGSGKRVDLSFFEGIDTKKIILAGGLTPENLPEVLSFDFYGYDVSSGVEAVKGKKNLVKVKEFITSIKSV